MFEGTMSSHSSSFASHSSQEKTQQLYSCRHCDIHFIKKHFWYRHVIHEHGKEELELDKDVLYSCSYCLKNFKHEISRSAHKRNHKAQSGKSLVIPAEKPATEICTWKKFKTRDGQSASEANCIVGRGG